MTLDQKSELVARAQKIINAEQLMDLNGVIDMLAEIEETNRMKNYFILVDRLDERWVDDTLRFRLIRALIESLKAFRKIRDLKIIVAMRSDVLERVVQETADLGFQREKYDNYFVRLKWSKEQLKELVGKRINQMFRKKYTAENIHFEDVFSYNVGQVQPFTYILDRTLMRPRDMITFINQALEKARGRYEVTANFIKAAEQDYSRIRKQALEDEWRSAFPSLPNLLTFLGNRKSSMPITDMMDEKLETLAYTIGVEDKAAFDPLYGPAMSLVDKRCGRLDFAREVASILYRVGAIGVKLRPDERVSFSHIDHPIVLPALIGEDCRIRIHPMLYSALNIR